MTSEVRKKQKCWKPREERELSREERLDMLISTERWIRGEDRQFH